MRHTMLLTFAAFLPLGAACTADHGEATSSSAEHDLVSTTGASSPATNLCAEPVTSDDGKYALFVECPNASDGAVVRVDVASGARRVISTYPASDVVSHVASSHGRVYFTTMHGAISPEGKRLSKPLGGAELTVRDWELTEERTIKTDTGAAMAKITADGGHVVAFFAVDRANPTATWKLVVAPTSGRSAPANFDIAATLPVPFHWLAGNRMLVSGLGGEGVVIDIGGPNVATSRSVSFGDARPRSFESTFDGERIVAEKQDPATGLRTLVLLNVLTKAEILLDQGADSYVPEERRGSTVLFRKRQANVSSLVLWRAGRTTVLETSTQGNHVRSVQSAPGARFFVTAAETPTLRVYDWEGTIAPKDFGDRSTGFLGKHGAVLTYDEGGSDYTQIDVRTGTITKLPLPAGFYPNGPAGVAGDGAVYVTTHCSVGGGGIEGSQVVRLHNGTADATDCTSLLFKLIAIPSSATMLGVADDVAYFLKP